MKGAMMTVYEEVSIELERFLIYLRVLVVCVREYNTEGFRVIACDYGVRGMGLALKGIICLF